MIVLVDFDNLPSIDRKRGLDHIVIKLIETVGARRLAHSRRVRIKLYGGWFEQNQLTNRAQFLKASISQSFPKIVATQDGGVKATPIVRVDMGYSLEIEPAFNLEGTFRRRGAPKGLACTAPPIPKCANVAGCPVKGLHAIVSNEVCSDSSCSVSLSDVLTRNEQKLVDTMMVADMIHLATRAEPEFAVVSSDDDLWIGIKSALLLGSKVIHVHTIPGRRTHMRYKIGAGNNYTELNLYP